MVEPQIYTDSRCSSLHHVRGRCRLGLWPFVALVRLGFSPFVALVRFRFGGSGVRPSWRFRV